MSESPNSIPTVIESRVASLPPRRPGRQSQTSPTRGINRSAGLSGAGTTGNLVPRQVDRLRQPSPITMRAISPLRPGMRQQPNQDGETSGRITALPMPSVSQSLSLGSSPTSSVGRSISGPLKPPSGRLRRMSFDDGSKVEGRYMGGKVHGLATVTYPNGERYIGEMIADKRHGEGRFFHSDGSRFEGFWQNDKRHGPGKYISENGDRYEGMWADGYYHGFGVYSSHANAGYSGDWVQGKQHGVGRYTRTNGDTYEGYYMNDSRQGYGEFTYHTGDVYAGYFRASHYDGFGTFTSRDGSSYAGEWSCGKKCGGGVLTSKTKRKYKQKWVQGKLAENAEVPAGTETRDVLVSLDLEPCLDEISFAAAQVKQRLEEQQKQKDKVQYKSLDSSSEPAIGRSRPSPITVPSPDQSRPQMPSPHHTNPPSETFLSRSAELPHRRTNGPYPQFNLQPESPPEKERGLKR